MHLSFQFYLPTPHFLYVSPLFSAMMFTRFLINLNSVHEFCVFSFSLSFLMLEFFWRGRKKADLNKQLSCVSVFLPISSKARVNCEKKRTIVILTRPWVHKQPPAPPFAHHFHHHHAATTTNSQPLYETPIYPEMGSGPGGPGGIPAGSYHDSSGASHQVKLEATNFYLLKCLWIPSDSYPQFSVEWTAIFEL